MPGCKNRQGTRGTKPTYQVQANPGPESLPTAYESSP